MDNTDMTSQWDIELDEQGFGNYRIISAATRERWKRYKTSARVPYVATVYSLEVAQHIMDLHNKGLENG